MTENKNTLKQDLIEYSIALYICFFLINLWIIYFYAFLGFSTETIVITQLLYSLYWAYNASKTIISVIKKHKEKEKDK